MGWSCSGHRQHILHLTTPVTRRKHCSWRNPTGWNHTLPGRWVGRAAATDNTFCTWPPRSPDVNIVLDKTPQEEITHCQVDRLVVQRPQTTPSALATPVTRPDSVWYLPVGFHQEQCLRPTTSKDTTRIERAHQHLNRERHTRHAWEGLAGMGVSPGHLSCHTWGAHRMHLRSL